MLCRVPHHHCNLIPRYSNYENSIMVVNFPYTRWQCKSLLLFSAVRYEMGQDPKLLFSGSVTFEGPMKIALSPDGRTVAIGASTKIGFWDAVSGKEEAVLENVHPGNFVR